MSLYRVQLGQGPDLVLLHGWGMNSAVWEPLLPALSARHRLTILELPGHGASASTESAVLDDWAQRCLAIAPPRAHWLGWSLGGQVALAAALSAPPRVGGLSLIGVTPCFVQTEGWDCAMPEKTFHQFADALAQDSGAGLLRFLALQVKGSEHARDTLRLLKAELAQRPPASAQGLAQGLDLLLHTDLRERLIALRCPSHWMFGARDTLVPRALQTRLGELLPSAHVTEIAGAGHAPFLSHPEASLHVLLESTGQGCAA
jgi:pimeloyl-[acyl-carrier protein] methyl ester esterase